jgi:SulP family sulfate permease
MQNIVVHSSLDYGLEWCEDRLLDKLLEETHHTAERRAMLFDSSFDHLLAQLDRQAAFEVLVERLEPWLEPHEFADGDAITVQGERVERLHLLVRGDAVEQDPQGSGRRQALSPGSVIDAPAAYGEYAAPCTIMAETRCRTMSLSIESRQELERQNTSLACAFSGFLICASGQLT